MKQEYLQVSLPAFESTPARCSVAFQAAMPPFVGACFLLFGSGFAASGAFLPTLFFALSLAFLLASLLALQRAHALLHGLQWRDLHAHGRGLQVHKTPRAHQHAAF